jgi:multimeric flavodoxin WrbA
VGRTKLIIVKGSPRENGNSAILAAQVAAAAEAAGAAVESFYLHGMDIQPCDACDFCQGAAEIGCVIEDDMQILYPKIKEADAILYASPIYWFTVSAQLKLFMDRCYSLGGGSDYVREHGLAGKRFGVVLTYGDDDPFNSGAVNALRTFQDTFNYLQAEIAGMVYGQASGAGEIEDNRDLMAKAYELGRKLGTGT